MALEQTYYQPAVDCKGPLCFVWLSLTLFIGSVIIFAVSVNHRYALYAGIVCLLFSLGCAAVFICTHYWVKRPQNCTINVTKILRLLKSFNICFKNSPLARGSEDCPPTVFSGCQSANIGHSNFVIDSYGSSSAIWNINASIKRKPADVSCILDALKQELHSMYNQYGSLRITSSSITSSLEDYSKLDSVNSKLTKWTEGLSQSVFPSNKELNEARHILDLVQQNIVVLRNSHRGRTRDISTIPPVNCTSVHQLMLYTSQMPSPPPYQQNHDNSATILSNETDTTTNKHANYCENTITASLPQPDSTSEPLPDVTNAPRQSNDLQIQTFDNPDNSSSSVEQSPVQTNGHMEGTGNGLGRRLSSIPNAVDPLPTQVERHSREIMSTPLHTNMAENQLDSYVVNNVNNFVSANNSNVVSQNVIGPTESCTDVSRDVIGALDNCNTVLKNSIGSLDSVTYV